MADPYNTMEMSICPQCGHQVPSSNLEIHLASACGRVARSGAQHSAAVSSRTAEISSTFSSTNRSDLLGANSSTTYTSDLPLTIPSHIIDDETDYNTPQNQPTNAPTSEKQWTCPRCTLFNPLHARRCDACDYAYSDPNISPAPQSPLFTRAGADYTRPPDPIQRHQQLVQSPPLYSDSSHNSSAPPFNSMRFVGGGALIGSILGAAGAYIRGRNIANSMMEGAVTGALGGVIARDVLAATSPPTLHPSSAQENDINPESAEPRRFVSITRRRYPDGTVETICEENGVRVVEQRQSGDAMNETLDTHPFMMAQTPLLHAVSTNHNSNNRMTVLRPALILPPHGFRVLSNASGTHGYNLDEVDGMDYERLLEIFGDGSDRNRVADESMIRRLPTTTLKNIDDELPNDREHRLCSICLEEFSNGQTRKVLPCLHGFHDSCIDRWLLNANACCPICKHSLHEATFEQRRG